LTELTNQVEIAPTSLVYGGDALGRLGDGRAVFIPFGIPGERVKVNLVEQKRGFLKGYIVEILSPAPNRIRPRCKHFGVCGGCHYQHLGYADQLEAKQAIVAEQLRRLGGFANPPVAAIRASPLEWSYRNNLQFHLGKNAKLGFRGVDPSTVVEIEECHLPLAGIGATWPSLSFEKGLGFDRVELRQGNGDDLLLNMHSQSIEVPEFTLDLPISIVLENPEGIRAIAGDTFMSEAVKDRHFMVSASSFFQVNNPQAEAMVDFILDHLDFSNKVTFLDLYCGVGLFSAFIAPMVKHCVGVEASPFACEDFAENLDEFENVDLYEGLVEEILPHLEIKPEIVLMDPPRSGVGRRALDAIVTLQPDQIAYVSCDPSTLARDLIFLVGNGYSLSSVQPFDLFPQTFHIECIALLQRANS
jgi:23S rRNA (uracil1939-C5)-methyltransferase